MSRLATLLLATWCVTVPLAAATQEAPAERTSALRTIEGEVVAIGEGPAEGDVPVMVLRLDDPELGAVLLAPAASLEAMGFRAEVGDRVRARVFVDENTRRAFAQKVLNRDRGLMIRLRTLNRQPVWDARGHWQGPRKRALRDRASDRRPRRPVRRQVDRARPRPQSR